MRTYASWATSWSAAILVALATSALSAQAAPAPSADEQAVLAPLQAFLHGIATGDKAAMAAQALPDAMITRASGGKVTQKPLHALVDAMPAPTARKLEERIHDPLIRIDEDLAIIWAPYDFLIDGKVDHCGTDVVELVRRDGHWLISGLADTSRKTCGAPAKPAR